MHEDAVDGAGGCEIAGAFVGRPRRRRRQRGIESPAASRSIRIGFPVPGSIVFPHSPDPPPRTLLPVHHHRAVQESPVAHRRREHVRRPVHHHERRRSRRRRMRASLGSRRRRSRPRDRPRRPSQREALEPHAHVRPHRAQLVGEDGDAGRDRRVRSVLVAAVVGGGRRRRQRSRVRAGAAVGGGGRDGGGRGGSRGGHDERASRQRGEGHREVSHVQGRRKARVVVEHRSTRLGVFVLLRLFGFGLTPVVAPSVPAGVVAPSVIVVGAPRGFLWRSPRSLRGLRRRRRRSGVLGGHDGGGCEFEISNESLVGLPRRLRGVRVAARRGHRVRRRDVRLLRYRAEHRDARGAGVRADASKQVALGPLQQSRREDHDRRSRIDG
mmetsp:Transcript_14444/g.62659  ORF Transcript_14444/g.62659 Transcript_14444/m.62659 type:complete len:382 (-) Transcript_14444:336-1481(-)